MHVFWGGVEQRLPIDIAGSSFCVARIFLFFLYGNVAAQALQCRGAFGLQLGAASQNTKPPGIPPSRTRDRPSAKLSCTIPVYAGMRVRGCMHTPQRDCFDWSECLKHAVWWGCGFVYSGTRQLAVLARRQRWPQSASLTRGRCRWSNQWHRVMHIFKSAEEPESLYVITQYPL